MSDPNFTQPDPADLPNNLSVPAPQDAPGPRLLYRIFVGDEGLRAGWGILLFVLLCLSANYTVSHLHLLPSQPHATPGQSSPGHCQLAEHGTARGRERVLVRNQ